MPSPHSVLLTTLVAAAIAPRAAAQYATLDQVLLPSPAQSFARFGKSVDLDGARLVVGSGSRETTQPLGNVRVFRSTPIGWVNDGTIVPADLAAGDDFGVCHVDGDTITIGGVGHDAAGANVGAVWIYVRSGSSWVLQQKLLPSSPVAEMAFGAHALDGDELVVGAWQGRRAYHYRRSGAVWSEQQILVPDVASAAEGYGASLALDGNRLAVGAFFGANGAGQPAGAVYLYTRATATDPWTLDVRLSRPDSNVGASFGAALALEGDRLAVGAPMFGPSGLPAGAAFVYLRGASSWVEEARLTAAWIPPASRYGAAVALAGDYAFVGAPYDSAVHVHRRFGGTWSAVQRVAHSENPGLGSLGGSLAIDGSVLVAGAASYGAGAVPESGRAAVHRFGPEIAALCFGDDTGTPCPCANASYPGLERGCNRSNPAGQSGARLVVVDGYPSVAQDTVVLSAESAGGASTCLFFQGNGVTNFGLGVVHGDGLLCVAGSVVRLGTRVTDSLLTAQYPGTASTTPISVVGSVAAGDVRYYQTWMRDASPTFCTAATWNFTNALRIAWQP